jgi:hypothetical protein
LEFVVEFQKPGGTAFRATVASRGGNIVIVSLTRKNARRSIFGRRVRCSTCQVAFGSKLGSGEPFAESPIHPDEWTSSDRADWSVSCQVRTLREDYNARTDGVSR